MEPAAAFAAAAAAFFGLPPLAATLRGLRPTRLPSWRWAGGLSVMVVLTRGLPAGAQLPPPPIRWEPPPPPEPSGEGPERPQPPPQSGGPDAVYRVRPGDSLWAIACRALRASGSDPTDADVDRYWRVVYSANRSVVGDDPDLIFPGQMLTLPEES
ncbi:MAG: LysM peptidoglycan-binding domain-containing protein [Actinomycetota bacterium]|nr:LysM peptidoglycan-binding domain-containing protein [Actinomycetota bacterium]